MANEAAIPQLPASCLQVLQLIAQDEPNLKEIHHAILTSPAMTASVLRMASSAFYNRQSRAVSDVRTAIQILGLKTIRSIAFAVMMQGAFAQIPAQSGLKVNRFIKHSMFVGLFASSLFQVHRSPQNNHEGYDPDELFAAGVLHEVGPGILATQQPGVFHSIAALAEKLEVTFSDAFAHAFGHRSAELTIAALETWQISDRLVSVVKAAFTEEAGTRPLAASCLRYADFVLTQQGLGLLEHTAQTECPDDVLDSAGISEEEGRSAVAALSETCELWMSGSGAVR